MNPIGTVHRDPSTGRHHLDLRRAFRAPIDDVWSSITESDRLARWFGTWEGDPAQGHVMVTMTAEADPVPPVRYEIHACAPPRRLEISAKDEYGHWKLTVELSESDGTTTLLLRQDDVDPSSVHETGPGWEWYLDRLVAAVEGATPPSLADFDRDYLPLGAAYRLD